MDQSSDTFAHFLAALIRHLDDHQLHGPELAAELFVSRSLLDRLVTASAGEPPARLRRRLLLERAAFQLRSTGVSIIDAATQAGYSSNEAFTRAFRRAYGVPPSSWRSSGGAIHIASPSAGELTGSQLDAPIELPIQGIDDNPTIRSLLSRLVGQLDMWNAAMASVPYDFDTERHETLGSMRQRLEGGGRAFARYVRQVSDQGRFDETFVDATGCVPYVFTAAGMIAHVLTYAAHRRALVVGALASAGVAELDDDPLTWFRT